VKIDIVHPGYMRVQPDDLERSGLGGNETAMVLASRRLAVRGHVVRVFADCENAIDRGVRWLSLSSLAEREYRDVIIFWVRTKRFAPGNYNAPVRVAKLGLKRPNDGLLEQVLDGSINLLIAFSNFQRDLYLRDFGFPASANWIVTADGLDIEKYAQPVPKARGKFLHAANPKRGLQLLLDMWPAVRAEHSEAELFIASSHLLRGVTVAEDYRRAGSLYQRAMAMADDGVRFMGRVAKPELIEHQLSAEFYLYPTSYPETCCIAALEAAAAGDVILCSPAGALPDRVIDGVTGFLVNGDPSEPYVARKFLDRIGMLAEDAHLRERMAQAARELAAAHDYSRVLPVWEEAFAQIIPGRPGTD
jgi:glycosyltransferase involved in cell wall biosynthesis